MQRSICALRRIGGTDMNQKQERAGCRTEREIRENRRRLIRSMGAAAAAAAAVTALPMTAAAAEEKYPGVRTVGTVAELKALDVSALTPGACVYVGGYNRAGDGGAKLMRWAADSMKDDNGGTVHRPKGVAQGNPGRFEAVHDGVGDFRWYGIFDETVAADAAFLSMAGDGAISTIRAYSDLLFLRRNTVTRSRITLDFNGHTVYTYGSDGDSNSGSATFFFTGELLKTKMAVTLSEDLPEYSENYPVKDSSRFTVGQWYTLNCDTVPGGGGSERELQKLAKVVGIPDETHVTFDYKLGWPLAKGRRITYQQVSPVHDVCIKNMHFVGSGRPTTTAGGTGSNPISFEYAVRCNVYNCHATQSFWSMIFRRYNTQYVTEFCSLYNPVEIQVGGTGYLTQQIACCYGVVRDCVAAQMRHLTDFTGSAYCEVINCHAVGDNMGPFGTHGQYEHDLTFIGNSGLIGLTNTMTVWGRAAKNVVIKRHTGAAVLIQNFVTNVTLEDVHTFQEPGMVYAGMIKANVDGLIMRHCHADTTLMLSQYTDRSHRPCIISDCSFKTLKGQAIGRIGAHVSSEQLGNDKKPIWSPVTFRNCTIEGIDDSPYYGIGELLFERCTLRGASAGATPWAILAARTRFVECELADLGLVFISTERAQKVELVDTRITGASDSPAIEVKNIKFPVSIDLRGVRFERGEGQVLLRTREGAVLSRLTAVSCEFEGGKSELSPASFGEEAVLWLNHCLQRGGYTWGELPEESARIQYKKGAVVLG